jgi:hypothetical protein
MNYIQNTQTEESPNVGDLALNEDGALGIVTAVRRYGSYMSCSGVHVSNDYAPKGSVWESKNPRVIGCVDDAKAFVESRELPLPKGKGFLDRH